MRVLPVSVAATAVVTAAAALSGSTATAASDTALAQQIVSRAGDFTSLDFGGFTEEQPSGIGQSNDYGPPYCRDRARPPRPTGYASSLLTRYRVILTGQSYQGIATSVRLYRLPDDASAAWGDVSHERFAKCLLRDRVAPKLFTRDGQAISAKPVPALRSRDRAESVAAYRLVTRGVLGDHAETNGYLDLLFVRRDRVLVTVSMHSFDTSPFLQDRQWLLEVVRRRLTEALGRA